MVAVCRLVRVSEWPCIIVSPWTAGGWVCSEPFDHTSNLRLLERITGVKAPYISDWRRKTFGDFASVFRLHDKPAAPPTMPDTEAQWERAKYEIATLPKPLRRRATRFHLHKRSVKDQPFHLMAGKDE
jgi:phospholipase C